MKVNPSVIVTTISTITAFACVAMTIWIGGATTQEIEIKGNTYEVDLNMQNGIEKLIEKCKLNRIGDKCQVAINAKVTLVKFSENASVLNPN